MQAWPWLRLPKRWAGRQHRPRGSNEVCDSDSVFNYDNLELRCPRPSKMATLALINTDERGGHLRARCDSAAPSPRPLPWFSQPDFAHFLESN